MFSIKNKAVQAIILTGLLLSACSSSATQTAAVDPNIIFTAAAQTVQAQLTQAAGANPAPTETQPAPPTDEPVATAVIEQAVETPMVPPGATLPVLAPATQEAPGTPEPIATLPGVPAALPTQAAVPAITSTLGPTADKCEFVTQDPADNTVISKSTKMDQIWMIKNVGKTTWKKTTYMLRFYSGDRIGSGLRRDYPFRNDVKPGETYQAIADISTGTTSGKFTGTWTLWNGERNYCVFTNTLVVE